MENKSDKKLQIKRERDAVDRINKLSDSALKAAIFSIENVDDLERFAKVGEDYMEALSMSRKDRIRKI
jgi:hypothetical protein